MDHMERRQNEELMEARRLRRQEQKRKLLMRQRVLAAVLLVIFVLSLILILRGCLLLVPACARNAYEALQQSGCLVCQLVCHLALLSFPMSKVTQ